jgi:hypothetical protein
MKYRINQHDEMEFDVIVEDGGVVSVYHNDENQVSVYYQDRISEDMEPDQIWETLGEGKAYMKDWPDGTSRDEIIRDALSWLVLPAPESWELDESIWKKFELAW